MYQPLVSIVIPVYNGSNFLREAIDSALAQTYPNCEVIVVNDGSTDDTEQITLSYSDRIVYFYKGNGGVATALNFAIKRMKGEYLSWLSHDDVYYPYKIEAQIDALRQDGDMTKIVFGDFDVLYQDSGKRIIFNLAERGDATKLEHSVYPLVRSLIGGCSLLIHKSYFERVGAFNSSLRYVQDYDKWLDIFSNQKTIYINKLMYTVRNHSLQGTQAFRDSMMIEEIYLWKRYINNLSNEEMTFIYGSKLLFLLNMRERFSNYRYIDDVFDCQIKDEIIRCGAAERLVGKIKKPSNDTKLLIFGAGRFGLELYWLLKQCQITVDAFIDNSSEKQNTIIDGNVYCISFECAIVNYPDSIYIVAMKDNSAVLKQLQVQNLKRVITKQSLEESLL